MPPQNSDNREAVGHTTAETEELTILPEDLEFQDSHWEQVMGSLAKVQTSVRGATTSLSQSDEEIETGKVRDRGTLTLLEANPQAVALIDGHLLVKGQDGSIRQYTLEDEEIWSLSGDSISSERVGEVFAASEEPTSLSSEELAKMVAQKTRIFSEFPVLHGYGSLSVPDTSFKLEAKNTGNAIIHRTRVRLKNGSAVVLLDTTPGELDSLTKTTVSSWHKDEHGTLAWCHFEFEDGVRDVLFYADPAGKIKRLSNDESMPFQTQKIGSSTELVSLGNVLLIKRGDQLEAVNTPGLGDFQRAMTIGSTTYACYNRLPQGQLVIAVDTQTGTLKKDTGEQGLISADAIAFDEKNQCLYALQPGKSPRVKGVQTIDLRDLTQVTQDLEMDDRDRDTVLGGLEAFQTGLPEGQEDHSADALLGHQTRLMALHETLSDLSAHAHVQPVFNQVRAALRTIDEVIEEAEQIERRRRNAVQTLDKADHEFFEVMLTQKLRSISQGNLGSYVSRLSAYPSARDNYLSKRPPKDWLPQERWERSEKDLAHEDEAIEQYKNEALELLKDLIPQCLEEGRSYLLAVRDAQDHVALRKAEEAFEASTWSGLFELFNTIQNNARHFFRHDDTEAQEVKNMLHDAIIPQSSGVGKQDIQRFNLADVTTYRRRIFAEACARNIDQDAVEEFMIGIRRVEGLIAQLSTATSLRDIDNRLVEIQADLDSLEGGVYRENWLEYDARCQRALSGLQHQLTRQAEEAKKALYDREHLEKQELLGELERQIEMIEGLMLHAAQVEGAEAGHLNAEEQSTNAWNRVLNIVRGFDLTRRERVEEQDGTHPSMENLMTLLEKVERDYQDKERANKVWERLRQTLARCINRIEADKGYAINPGYYTLQLNKWYQDRLGAGHDVRDVMIPLAGKNPVQSLRVHTRVNTDGARPQLELSLVGDDSFKRVLPLSQHFYDVLPAYGWESPEDPELKRMYLCEDELCREEVAVYRLLQELKGQPLKLKGIVRDLVNPEFDERRKLDALDIRLGNMLDKLEQEQGFVFERAHRENILRIVYNLFLADLTKNTSPDTFAQNISIDDLLKQESSIQVEGLTSTHSSLRSGGLSLSPQALSNKVAAFDETYGEELKKLNAYIKLNQDKVRRQMGLDQQAKAIGLPYDFHPTGRDVVFMGELLAAYQQVQNSDDKGMVIVIGDVGEGKTVLVRAFNVLTNRRLHELNGQKLRHITTFDPFEQFSDAANYRLALSSTAAQQMFLFCATLVTLSGTTAMIDEFPYLSSTALDSLLAALDVRRELPVNVHLDPWKDEDLYDDTLGIYSDQGINAVNQDAVAMVTGNKSIQSAQGEYVDVTVSEQVKSRSIVLDIDKTNQENEFLWKAGLVERGSADLQLHPEDLQYLIARRMPHGRMKQGQKVDHTQLKTEFHSDADPRLKRIIDAIDMRCMAAQIIVNIQKATATTRQFKGDLTQLGVPPCWMTAVGGRDVKELFPKLYNLSGEREARQVIYRYLKTHLNDRGAEHTETNRIFLAQECKVWEDYPAGQGESIWKEQVALARRRKAVGESDDVYAGILNGIFTTLDNVGSQLSTALGSPSYSDDNPEGTPNLLQTFSQLQTMATQMAEKVAGQAPQKAVLDQLKQLQETTNEALGGFTKALLLDRADRKRLEQAFIRGLEMLAEFNTNMYGGAADNAQEKDAPEPPSPAAGSSVPNMDFG